MSNYQRVGFLMMDHYQPYRHDRWSLLHLVRLGLRLHEAPCNGWEQTKTSGFPWVSSGIWPIGFISHRLVGWNKKPVALIKPSVPIPTGRTATRAGRFRRLWRWRSRRLANKRPMASHDLLPGTQMGSFASQRLGGRRCVLRQDFKGSPPWPLWQCIAFATSLTSLRVLL